MDLVEKLNYIIKSFINNDARLWEIGTDFYSTWINFHNILRKVYNFSDPQSNQLFFKIKSSNNKRFEIIFNGQNVTPITKNNKEAAQSTLRQYFQIGYALKFIDFPEKTVLKNNVEIPIINKSLPRFLSQNNPEEFLSDYFLNGLYTWWNDSTPYIRNLYFSILMSLIDEYDEKLFLKLDNFEIKMKSKRKFGDIGSLHSSKFILIIKKTKGSILMEPETFKNLDESLCSTDRKFNFDLYKKNYNKIVFRQGKGTYTKIAKKIIKNYDFEKVVEKIYQQIINPDNDIYVPRNNFSPKQKSKDFTFLDNYLKELDSLRGLLRENIISKRFSSNNSNSSDLEHSKENSGNNDYIQLMEACHIYDVQYIKEDLENIFNKYFENDKDLFYEEFKKLKEIIQDSDNGILMNKCCHSLFDKSIVWFDNNGNLQWQKEKEELVRKTFGEDLDDIRIKPEIFTKKMSDYMFKRITIRKI